MKNFIKTVTVFLLLSGLVICQQDNYSNNSLNGNNLVEFTSSNLPIVVINTNGQIIPDEIKITADMGIIYNGEGVRNFLTDPFNNYDGQVGIEVRGSTSQWFPKKQYAFETRDSAGNDLAVSLINFPEESDWILFAPYNDKSLMRDVLAYRISNDLNRYASRSKFCEVVLNGEYIGVYVLFEKVKRDANRVNIKKLNPTDISGDALTGGYIIKIDKTDGENNDGWYSNYLPNPQSSYAVFYQYHYPKPDEIVSEQKTYIQHKIFNFETLMKYGSNIADTATGYPKFIDTDSFVDFFLTNEVAKNVDSYRLSTYLYKDRDSRNPKIFAGPVWDFNLGFGNSNYYDGWLTTGWQLEFLTNYQNMPVDEPFLTPSWWRRLFDDVSFRNKVYARWQVVKNEKLNTQSILGYIDSLTTLLDESKTRNFEKWPVLGQWIWPNYFVGQTYQQEISYLKNWITFRLNWMNLNMIGEPTDVDDTLTEIPVEFSLKQNYPNPFNPSTKISFSIPNVVLSSRSEPGEEGSRVQLKIFDILGKEVALLVNENKSAGSYEIEWNAEGLPSGIYFYQLTSGNFIQTKKMILLQ
ncbi:MAG TPA: spore coat protein CotH [Ignavibacteriales bacterium]|nr:spore coat protein CotH [Ignavibacteriales bacterium]